MLCYCQGKEREMERVCVCVSVCVVVTSRETALLNMFILHLVSNIPG